MSYRIEDRVQVDVVDGVADVRLARPDKINALDAPMMTAIAAAAERLASTKGVRAVVLSGEGEGFCAGLDMGYAPRLLVASEAERLRERSHGDANLFQHLALAWRDLPMPVIAALHGVVYGGGLQIALGADLRYASADARLSVMEIRWALIPDMAISVLLRGQVRPDVVRELVYTARIVEADEALRLGLVTRVCDAPRAEALSMAREIAGRSPAAIRAVKRLVTDMTETGRGPALQAESDIQAALLHRGENLEAFRAHAERREPRYAD